MHETLEQTVHVPTLPDDLTYLDVVSQWDTTSPYVEWKTSITVPPTFLPSALPRVIAICNQKGGVGKTVTALELALALVARGLRVRIIDADPQAASMSVWLRFFYPEGVTAKTARNLVHLFFDETLTLDDVTYPTPYKGLFFIPSRPDLDDVNTKHPTGTDTLLRYLLNKPSDHIDVNIIDCGPSLGPLTASALVASQDIVIPVQAASGLDVHGAASLNSTIKTVQARMNPDLRVAAVVLTDFERSNLARKIGGRLARAYPDAMMLPARTCVRIGDAQLAKTPLRVLEPRATTVLDYDRGAQLLFPRELTQ
ncbi:ParA family protein [Streptomyces noursei]